MSLMSSMSKSVWVRTALAGLMMSAAGCVAQEGDVAEKFTADPGGDVAAAAPARVVASLKTVDGATVQFVDESEPGAEPSIGVEISNSLKTPVVDALLAQEPSALELYLALAPAGEAPSALVREHALQGAAAPRQLAANQLDGESSGYFDCADSTGWQTAFQAWSPVLDGEFIGKNESGYTTGYVGYAPKFYFDVCRPYDLVAGLIPYYTGVQRRTSSTGTWTTINSNTDALDYQQRRWRYYRSTITCSSYQYRLVVSGTSTNRYHRGARWADEWSCQIGS